MSVTNDRSRFELANRRTWAWRRRKTLSHSVSCISGAEGGGDGDLSAATDTTVGETDVEGFEDNDDDEVGWE